MNAASKLPYKVQFEPEYQYFHERMSKLIIPPINPNATIYPIDQIINLEAIKQKIKEEELQFFPQNIYSQYATANELKEGKKNANQMCPNCGQENKKPVQCQFCAVMYCKNCCWRKRVLPHLSQPKQFRTQCQDCHSKFVKLFINQKFYEQSAVLQKIIDTCSGRIKKVQKDVKAKKQKIEVSQKKKKQSKIRQNMLLKQLKDQQKKIQQLQQRLEQVVKKKAQQMKEAQEKEKENEKIKQQQRKKEQQQQLQKKRKQEERNQAIRRQKQLEEEREAMRKKQSEHQKQIQRQQKQMLEEKQKQRILLEAKRKQEEKRLEENKKLEVQNTKNILALTQHIKEVDELRNLAKDMMKQPQHFNQKEIVHVPESITDIISSTATQKSPKSKQKETHQHKPQATNPIEDLMISDSIKSKQQQIVNSKPQKVQQKAQPQKQKPIQNIFVGFLSASKSQSNQKQKSDKIQLTESTEKANNDEQSNSREETKKQQNQNFNTLNQVAINVSEMTVNQLLGIHVNPYADQNNSPRRLSQRQSYKEKEDRRKSQIQQIEEQTPPILEFHETGTNELTSQEKQEILRSSNISASLLHSKNTDDDVYQHQDPAGGKCNCQIM